MSKVRPKVMTKEEAVKVLLNYKEDNQKLVNQVATLKYIIDEIQWMARRYAHGRMTYAVSQYNDAIKLAQSMGMEFRPDPIDGLLEAKDGMFDKEWFESNKEKR